MAHLKKGDWLAIRVGDDAEPYISSDLTERLIFYGHKQKQMKMIQ